MRQADIFCGAGGLTEAARRAGWTTVWAANHWRPAVETHAANHPDVPHVLQDVLTVDWTTLPSFDALTAGCSCQGHSEAGQPSRKYNETVAKHHDDLRATAWAVVEAAAVCLPKFILVENVPQFEEWPLLPAWRLALELLGYHLRIVKLTASKFAGLDDAPGVPQRRVRLFVVALRGRGAQRKVEELARRLVDSDEPEPGIRPYLDFGAGRWTPIEKMRPPTAKQLREGKPYARLRAETAHRKFKGKPCWLAHVTHEGAWGRSPDEPITTITTQGQHALVRDGEYRLLSVEEYLGAQTLAGYKIPKHIGLTDSYKLIGNAVPAELGRKIFEVVEDVL